RRDAFADGRREARREPRPRHPARQPHRVRGGVLRVGSLRSTEGRARRGEHAGSDGVSATTVPLELLRRYNVPGPRYTSYPTAPSWKESLDPAAYARILQESSAGDEPPPLSLYFHLPFCERLC